MYLKTPKNIFEKFFWKISTQIWIPPISFWRNLKPPSPFFREINFTKFLNNFFTWNQFHKIFKKKLVHTSSSSSSSSTKLSSLSLNPLEASISWSFNSFGHDDVRDDFLVSCSKNIIKIHKLCILLLLY